MTSRRDQVLAALRSAGTSGLSGESLAGDLGVSRAAIAKHVRSLRDLGYLIEATPGSGYALRSTPDLPLAEEVRPLLGSELWSDLKGVARTGSTNDDCKELARSGAQEGTVVLAAEQTKGRGRLGRSWDSPGGGVYLSAILRPDLPLADLSPLPLVISLGVATGLESLGTKPLLKWPNDILLDEGKLGGILLESSAEIDRVEWIVVGIGVNVHRPENGFAKAAYLDDVVDVRLAPVAAAVLDGIAQIYTRFQDVGFSDLFTEYEKRFSLRGCQVVVRDIHGSVIAEGRAEGIDASGRLLVDGSQGSITVSAGDVTLRR